MWPAIHAATQKKKCTYARKWLVSIAVKYLPFFLLQLVYILSVRAEGLACCHRMILCLFTQDSAPESSVEMADPPAAPAVASSASPLCLSLSVATPF